MNCTIICRLYDWVECKLYADWQCIVSTPLQPPPKSQVLFNKLPRHAHQPPQPSTRTTPTLRPLTLQIQLQRHLPGLHHGAVLIRRGGHIPRRRLCVKQFCSFYPTMPSQLRYVIPCLFWGGSSGVPKHKMEEIQVLYLRAMASPTKAFWDWG